jgi:hypothetical protein
VSARGTVVRDRRPARTSDGGPVRTGAGIGALPRMGLPPSPRLRWSAVASAKRKTRPTLSKPGRSQCQCPSMKCSHGSCTQRPVPTLPGAGGAAHRPGTHVSAAIPTVVTANPHETRTRRNRSNSTTAQGPTRT